jgi:protein-L-isoaspartate(D-aspartate) O-methyltransferase
MGNKDLADYLQDAELLSPGLYNVFLAVDRKDFIPESEQWRAYEDQPIPIGYGQTISQPYTVAFMLEQLGIKPGQRVLDVGSGSGWTTALLARAIGRSGKIYGLERIPELVKFGRQNLAKYNFPWASIYKASERVVGLPNKAPYDRILVSAAAKIIPDELLDQLAAPGRLVIPVRNGLVRVDKDSTGRLENQTYPGFVFVPLITGE